jgi:hypothetical protein
MTSTLSIIILVQWVMSARFEANGGHRLGKSAKKVIEIAVATE